MTKMNANIIYSNSFLIFLANLYVNQPNIQLIIKEIIINIETSITNLLVTDKESASIDITIKIRYPRENSGTRQIKPINIAVTILIHLGAVFIFFTLIS